MQATIAALPEVVSSKIGLSPRAQTGQAPAGRAGGGTDSGDFTAGYRAPQVTTTTTLPLVAPD